MSFVSAILDVYIESHHISFETGAKKKKTIHDDVVAFDVNVQTGAYQTGKVTFYTCVSAEIESQVFYLYS